MEMEQKIMHSAWNKVVNSHFLSFFIKNFLTISVTITVKSNGNGTHHYVIFFALCLSVCPILIFKENHMSNISETLGCFWDSCMFSRISTIEVIISRSDWIETIRPFYPTVFLNNLFIISSLFNRFYWTLSKTILIIFDN